MSRLTHLLDTSVYSQPLRPKPLPSVISHWKRLGDATLAISAICESELIYGLEKRASQRLWLEYRSSLKDRLVLLPIDQAVAHWFGAMKADCDKKGTPRANFVLLIAATALQHQLTLATCNPKHFQDIPGLSVEDWNQ